MSLFHAGFSPDGRPVRVRFAQGGRHDLTPELSALSIRRALVLTTPEQAAQGEAVLAALGPAGARLFAGAVMHTPVSVTEHAMSAMEASGADGIVAIGGGSTIGLGKALAYRTDLPQIVLPTTYAGSEATPVLGQTEGGRKTTLRSPRVQPEAVVYDAELIAGLPVAMSVTSGLNAMAHAVEALYAQAANPLSSALAMSGLRAFIDGLPAVVARPDDLAAREATLFGAWLCGSMLDQVGMALHHKLCHTLGGTLNLPHAETHAIVLPQATAYVEAGVGTALQPLAQALGAETAAGGLYDFAARLGAPLSLAKLGVSSEDLDRVADLAVQDPYWNPVPIERPAIRALLQRAHEGARPH